MINPFVYIPDKSLKSILKLLCYLSNNYNTNLNHNIYIKTLQLIDDNQFSTQNLSMSLFTTSNNYTIYNCNGYNIFVFHNIYNPVVIKSYPYLVSIRYCPLFFH